jgi:hypothetical protein
MSTPAKLEPHQQPKKRYNWFDGPKWAKWLVVIMILAGTALTVIRFTFSPREQFIIGMTGMVASSFIMSLASFLKTFVKE